MFLMRSHGQSALPASPSPTLPTGFDGGNGSAKLVLDGHEVKCPSYVLPVHSELHDIPPARDGGLIEYVDGGRSDLHGQRYLVGFPAYQKSPLGHRRIVDDKRGKILWGFEMLLGCLSMLPWQERWSLYLVASIQDAQALGHDLHQSLAGLHRVRFNGSDRDSLVEITVKRIVEEGVGAVVTARTQHQLGYETIVYDFGNGTCIVSVFGADGGLVKRSVTPGGVWNLITGIAQNLETRTVLAEEGKPHIIRAGIENRTFAYGTTGWGFQEVYSIELRRWVEETLAPALKAASPWTPTADAKIAIGGGSELPMIRELLASKGITALEDGSWANARGLEQLAAALYAREVA